MYKLESKYKPTGDQPEAIKQIVSGITAGIPAQTLLGVTGSGKTFTMANVIAQLNRPALILSHNKTLAAQLYSELKGFFPHNAVEYFVSYYDYYQPEAYIATTDTYIEKDLAINQEIEKLRLSTTTSLLSGRRDVVVVSSVSCLYGIGNPDDFSDNKVQLKQGMTLDRNTYLRMLVNALYSRNETELTNGTFRVKGDTVDLYLAYTDSILRVIFWGDEVEAIEMIDPQSGLPIAQFESYNIYPANIFVTSKERIEASFDLIKSDLDKQVEYFEKSGRPIESKRIYERVTYDLEMIEEVGYCSGIENYSRYFDGRSEGSRPFCLLDYFDKDYILIIDESHVTLPQVRAMYGGDASRKNNLVEYGFRLPAARDNRPLKFEEFEALAPQTLYVSATPADYELFKSDGVIIEQLIRPTGLLDPKIVVRPTLNQIDDLMEEIAQNIELNERVLITTLTKKMAEELDRYLQKANIKSAYIHSDVDTLDRIRILDELRAGVFDVLIGVNLLREGLDLPQVSLVIILDADKEGFLRNHRSLTQTAGRAARHLNGRVIMYADKMTKSMDQTIRETEHRRAKQIAYNTEHNITPTALNKSNDANPLKVYMDANTNAPTRGGKLNNIYGVQEDKFENLPIAADPVIDYMTPAALEKAISKAKKEMLAAAKRMDFMQAAQYRDEMFKLEAKLNSSSK